MDLDRRKRAGLRESLSQILRLQVYVRAESSGRGRALRILRDRHVDVLIPDVHLPKVDGVTVLQLIGSPSPIVIIHSAFEFS